MVKIRGVVQGTPNLLKVLRFTTIAVCGFYLALMLLGLPVYVLLDPNTSSIELIKMLFELALWLSIPILGLMIVARAWRLSILGA